MIKSEITLNPLARPIYLHLEPIVDLLLTNGNELSLKFKWGENRTGFYCFLKHPLDFDLIERIFNIPSFVRLDKEGDAIECDRTWTTIRGGMA